MYMQFPHHGTKVTFRLYVCQPGTWKFDSSRQEHYSGPNAKAHNTFSSEFRFPCPHHVIYIYSLRASIFTFFQLGHRNYILRMTSSSNMLKSPVIFFSFFPLRQWGKNPVGVRHPENIISVTKVGMTKCIGLCSVLWQREKTFSA